MLRIPVAQLERLGKLVQQIDALRPSSELLASVLDEVCELVAATAGRAALAALDDQVSVVIVHPSGVALPSVEDPAWAERAISTPLLGRDGVMLGTIEVFDKRTTGLDAARFDGLDQALLGFVAGMLSSALDSRRHVQEVRQLADALQEERSRLQSLLDTVPCGIAAIGPDGQVVFTNLFAATMLGFDPLEPRESIHSVQELLLADGTRVDPWSWTQVVIARLGQPLRGEVAALRLTDGRLLWLLINGTPTYDRDGTPNGGILAFTDITERYELERRLAESEARLRASELVSGVGTWQYVAGDRRLTWSDGLYQLLGIEPREFATVEPYLDHVPPAERPQVREALEQSVPRGEPVHLTHHLELGGELRTVLLRGEPLDGDGASYIGTVRDITTELDEQERLQRAQQVAMIGRLAGGLAHDLNNLLTVLAGHAELLNGAVRDEATAGSVAAIVGATDRAAALTRQLLEVGRQQILQPQPLDVGAAVRASVTTFRAVLPESASLELLLPPDLPAVLIDPGKLDQVLLNLVLNAADALGESGNLVIGARLVASEQLVPATRRELAPGAYVCVEVHDDGVGMDRDVLARALEPFFSTKPRERGSGLGLSTSHGVIQQSGGHLEIDSELGVGTTVRLYLPVVDAEPLPPVTHERREPDRLHGTVLVAEDDDLVRDLTVQVLDLAGCEVLAACDGPSAIKAAGRHPGVIDLLLTDASMPGFGGHELARRLREVRPNTKVLFMSGYTEDSAVRQGIAADGVPFLAKPFTVDELVDKVRDLLGGQSTS